MYKHLSRVCQQVSRVTTQEKLINALFERFAGESETAIARRCGLSIARFSNYKLGKRDMDVDAVIGCAQALGWDVRSTVAAHEIEVAPTPRVKALWKTFASVALTLAIGAGLASPANVQAADDSVSASPSIHYAKYRIGGSAGSGSGSRLTYHPGC